MVVKYYVSSLNNYTNGHSSYKGLYCTSMGHEVQIIQTYLPSMVTVKELPTKKKKNPSRNKCEFFSCHVTVTCPSVSSGSDHSYLQR